MNIDLTTIEGRSAARSLGLNVPDETSKSSHEVLRTTIGTHRLVFPGLLPLLNQVRGRHWSSEAKAKKELGTRLRLCAIDQRTPQATCRRSVSLTVTLGPRRKQPDADAYDKILLDALVRCGLLLDDSARGLVGRVEIAFERGSSDETIITLTDVPP